MQNKRKKVLAVIIFITIAFIWGQSMLSKEDSSHESLGVLALIEPFLEIFLGKGNVTEHFVRKLAHFTEYALLGTELMAFFVQGSMVKRSFLLALSHGLFTAFVDETVQIFSGRGPMIQDMWIDMSGALFGIIFISIITVFLFKHKNQ